MSTRAYCQPQRSVYVSLHTSRDSIPCEHQLILNLLHHSNLKRTPRIPQFGMLQNQDEADCRPRCSPRSGSGSTPARQPWQPAGAPKALGAPAPASPAPAPLTLSFSARGLAWAGESPSSHQSERRWQWTRKLGCRCYCSPLGSGESLSLSSKRGEDHIFILETQKCSRGR